MFILKYYKKSEHDMEKPSILIVVVSDTIYRGEKEDLSGRKAKEMLENNGFPVKNTIVIPNSPKEIIRIIQKNKDVDVILFIGGTGISPRDQTIDTLEKISWRYIPGFGEVFRHFTMHKDIGKAVYSRAAAFSTTDQIFIAVPGSPDSIKIAVDIIVDSIEHLVKELRRFEGKHEH